MESIQIREREGKKKGTERIDTGEKRNLRKKTNIPCKYLQGNNVNEGRKLHQVSEENRKRSNGHKQRKKKFSLNMSKTLRVIRLVKNLKVAEVQSMHIFKKTGLKIKR